VDFAWNKEEEMNTLKQLFVSSRPLSWINTAFPFAAAYLMTTRQVDLTFILGTIFFLIPYNLAMYGINDVFDYESDMRGPRPQSPQGNPLGRSHHKRSVPDLPRCRGQRGREYRSGYQHVCCRGVFHERSALQGDSLLGLLHQQHPLREPCCVWRDLGRCNLYP
jgi:hypothetical protein